MSSASFKKSKKQAKPELDSSSSLLLDDQVIGNYLRDNPDFFLRFPHLLLELSLPHESGNAVSLVERQVAILRERNIHMRKQLADLLANATDNDRLFEATKNLTLSLWSVDTLEDLNQVFADDLSKAFDAELVCCHLAGTDTQFAHITGHATDLPAGHLSEVEDPTCLVLRGPELQALFADPADTADIETGSAVFIPTISQYGKSILVIGSRDPKRFSSDAGTLFVSFIGQALGHALDHIYLLDD